MKKNKKITSIIISLGLCMVFIGSPAFSESIKKPVIFSYHWPISKGQTDLQNWNMEMPNVIDVRCKTSERDAKLYWKNKGKIILCRVALYKDVHTKEDFNTENEMYEVFAKTIEISDGISIDEVAPKKLTKKKAEMFVSVLKKIRRSYPDKIISVWCYGDWDAEYAFVLKAIRDYADLFLPELYISQISAKKRGFIKFKNYITATEELAPGIKKKTVVGLGMYSKMNNDPSQSFQDHLSAQIKLLGTDPFFRDTLGIALYSPSKYSAEDQKRIDGVLKKYFSR